MRQNEDPSKNPFLSGIFSDKVQNSLEIKDQKCNFQLEIVQVLEKCPEISGSLTGNHPEIPVSSMRKNRLEIPGILPKYHLEFPVSSLGQH